MLCEMASLFFVPASARAMAPLAAFARRSSSCVVIVSHLLSYILCGHTKLTAHSARDRAMTKSTVLR